jgi:hypothetical protein
VRLDAVTAAEPVVRNVTLCDLVDIHQRFREPAVSISYPEHVGNGFLRNSKYLQDYMVSYPGTQ